MNQEIDDKMVFEKLEEQRVMKPLESNNITQSASQIIEDIDDTVIFDAPQKKSVDKSANHCLKVEKNLKPKEQDVRKSAESNNIAQSASQIIEEDTAIMDINECVEDVSFTFSTFISSLTIYIRKFNT